MPEKLKPYRKFLLAGAMAVGTLMAAWGSDGTVTPEEWSYVVGAAATALGVVLVPNKTSR